MKKFLFIAICITLLSGCFNDLPKCEDKESKELLSKIIVDNIKKQRLSFKYIDTKDIKEVGFNKEKDIRVCEANVLYSDGDNENIIYNIYWQGKDKSMFYVEIVN